MWLLNIKNGIFLATDLRIWDSFPGFIKICLIVSLLAIVGIVLAMLDIAIKRHLNKKEARQLAQLTEKINELLIAALVTDRGEKNGHLIKSSFEPSFLFKMGVSEKEVKKILVQELLKFRSSFAGSIADRARKLYMDLSLHTEALKRVHKKNWETKVNAMMELFKMDVPIDETYLQILLLDKNRYIREFARLALIKFTTGDPLQILREIKEPISQLEEIEMFLLFQLKDDYTPSSMDGLLSVYTEPTIASLCLKLAVQFDQESAVPYIIQLLQTEDLKLRGEAITALAKIGQKRSRKYLIETYPEQPQIVQLDILSALGSIQSSETVEFLEKEFIGSADFEIKKHASDALIQLYPLSKKIIEKLEQNEDPLNQIILSHSQNPLINAS